MRVKCLAQEHNTMSPATARSRVEHTSHEAIVCGTLKNILTSIVISEVQYVTPESKILKVAGTG